MGDMDDRADVGDMDDRADVGDMGDMDDMGDMGDMGEGEPLDEDGDEDADEDDADVPEEDGEDDPVEELPTLTVVLPRTEETLAQLRAAAAELRKPRPPGHVIAVPLGSPCPVLLPATRAAYEVVVAAIAELDMTRTAVVDPAKALVGETGTTSSVTREFVHGTAEMDKVQPTEPYRSTVVETQVAPVREVVTPLSLVFKYSYGEEKRKSKTKEEKQKSKADVETIEKMIPKEHPARVFKECVLLMGASNTPLLERIRSLHADMIHQMFVTQHPRHPNEDIEEYNERAGKSVYVDPLYSLETDFLFGRLNTRRFFRLSGVFVKRVRDPPVN